MTSPISRGFRRRHRPEPESGPESDAGRRTPPGQYLTDGFPVLSAGPTPHTALDRWSFSVTRRGATLRSWTWPEFQALAAEDVTADIHCVTRWSKLDTRWRGVPVGALLAEAGAAEAGAPAGGAAEAGAPEAGAPEARIAAPYVMAFCDGGYTANLPAADLTDGRAWVAYSYDGGPLAAEHGGPARLLVPHLYFWKSAKWVRGLDLRGTDEPGFWETYGYHIYGDPWREQRYAGD